MRRLSARVELDRFEVSQQLPALGTTHSDAVSPAGLRVALVSGNYNCVTAGANKALNRLARFLIDEGAEVRVYSPTIAEPAFPPEGELVSIPSVPIPSRPEYRIALPLPKSVRADIRQFSPTLFHLSAPDLLGFSAQAYAKHLGLPVVISHHTNFESYLSYYRMNWLSSWVGNRVDRFYDAADRLLAPNEPIAADFRAKGWAEKVSIWGRGVDTSVFSPECRDHLWRRSIGFQDDEPVVLFFGRIVFEKGLEMFAATIGELEARGKNVRPLVVGDGPALRWFQARLPNGIFTGHLHGAPLARAIASADVLINPSDSEAFGNVNLEAMASGLAIVSADVSSASVLIDDGVNGILVPPRDVDAYASAAAVLMDAPLQRMTLGRAARQASMAYDWRSTQEDVVRAYREVASW